MALPTRPLGISGMHITTVGYGAWAIGGLGWEHAWGPQSDRDSIATIRHAVERGINWIDTAPVYGHGHSEEVVGAALVDIPEPDRPYVFTKCGLIWDPTDPMRSARADARRIQWEVEHSLRRLRTERLDLLQVHWPPTAGPPLEVYWAGMVRLRVSGKVAAIGLSNHDTAQLAAAERIGHVDSLQPPFSLLRREAAAAEIVWCAEHGTGVINYSPLESGLLSGAFSAERVAALPETDWRRTAPEFTGDRLDRSQRLVDVLRRVAERHGHVDGRRVGAAAVAVAWTLAWPGVTGAIVGARQPKQVDDWLAAASLQLTSDDLEEIAGAIANTGAGSGPALPPVTVR
jgi:aryl-alcohol dehydrogenase-like predicted oxidoreductase